MDIDAAVARYLVDKGYTNAYKGLCKDLGKDELPLARQSLLNLIGKAPRFNATRTLQEIPVEVQFRGIPKPWNQSILVGSLVVCLTFADNVDEGPCAVFACADKSLNIYSLPKRTIIRTVYDLHSGAAIRFVRQFNNELLLTGGLDGRLILSKALTGEAVAIVRAHTKYVTSLDVYGEYIVSAGYDGMINSYKFDKGVLKKIVCQHLDSIPTCARIVELDGRLVVVVCRQDSTFLSCYYLDSLLEYDKLNLCDAEYVADSFTPMDLALRGTKFAVATNHVPYMRVITGIIGEGVINNFLVQAPQDQYSSPRLQWSMDGKVR
jgi:hypothetical protein